MKHVKILSIKSSKATKLILYHDSVKNLFEGDLNTLKLVYLFIYLPFFCNSLLLAYTIIILYVIVKTPNCH